MCLDFPDQCENLTMAERSILEYIETHREEFLFMTIGQLAEQLGVSEATISRFAKHVGCQDFKRLKNLVILQSNPAGAAGKMAATIAGKEEFTPAGYLAYQQECLQKTIEAIEENTFEKAIKAITEAHHVFIHAKSASASMGQLLMFRLKRIGIPVSLLPSAGSEMLEGLARVTKDDLVIMFSFSKVSWEGRTILKEQEQTGFQTIAFTSRLHMKQSECADMNLYVYRGEEQEYHSMTAAAAVVDALIVGLSKTAGAESAKQLKRIRELKKKYILK